jgi:TrmH family RNA methyltransferase
MPIITSRQNAIVARYRAAARGEVSDAIVLDGAHLVADALASRVAIREAALTAEHEDEPLARALHAAGAEVTIVSSPVMNALSPVRTSSGIVALAERPRAHAARVFTPAPPLVLMAIDVQDPGNVGALVRAAEAAGATGVVAAGACADPFGWKALRGSMGSALRLPIATAGTALDAIDSARRHGCRIVAAAPHGGRPFFDADLRGPAAVVVGGEGAGVPESVLAAADDRVTIPMQPPVESLNTAVAAALLLYEARRQRAPHAVPAR